MHKTVKLSGQDFTVKLRQGAVAPTQRGAVTRYCTLDTAGTMVGGQDQLRGGHEDGIARAGP